MPETPRGHPAARRAVRAGRLSWLDLRLVLGVLLVVVAVAGGVLTVTAADRSVEVWTVRSSLVAGSPVTAADLSTRSVRFVSPDVAGRYLSAREALPTGTVTVRSVGAGELLPRDAVAGRLPGARVELPLSVRVGDAPPALAVGQAVDVWAVPSDTAPRAGDEGGVRVLAAVPVQSRATGSGLGGSGTTSVTLSLDRDSVDLGSVLGRLARRRVVLTTVTGVVQQSPTTGPSTTGASATGPSTTGPSATAAPPIGIPTPSPAPSKPALPSPSLALSPSLPPPAR